MADPCDEASTAAATKGRGSKFGLGRRFTQGARQPGAHAIVAQKGDLNEHAHSVSDCVFAIAIRGRAHVAPSREGPDDPFQRIADLSFGAPPGWQQRPPRFHEQQGCPLAASRGSSWSPPKAPKQGPAMTSNNNRPATVIGYDGFRCCTRPSTAWAEVA